MQVPDVRPSTENGQLVLRRPELPSGFLGRFFFFFFYYLFIYLAALGLSCSTQDLCFGTWTP